jgi:glycosyltransferase involved in cell wall biosynthesis
MRIAVVETMSYGGLLHYGVQLADALAERGHDVDLIVTRENELSGHRGAATMRAILPPPVAPARSDRTRAGYLLRRARVAARLSRAWLRIGREARAGRYDAVVFTLDLDLWLAAAGMLALSHRPHRPLLAAVSHNVRPYNKQSGEDLHVSGGALARLLTRLYPRLDLVLVHGERSRREFEATWPPARLAEIPHGDEGIFAKGAAPPPATEARVLFFGDWRKVKGLTVLMDAFDLLAARRPEVRLTIAGQPAPADFDPAAVSAWAARHDGRVEVIDRYVEMDEVPAIFGRARVVVTPYLVGYQSGVLHLAMTMGRPVVTTNVGDLPAALGGSGRVVEPGDPAALADALEELAFDGALAERLGTGGRERVLAESSWAAVAERVDAALAPLLAQRR